ncbi:PAS domain-containing protein [Parvularcula dongshanensis]|uniref:PAS domain-containing protein n=1 Tax=Parvularcula dongshanensis TaxID=1173995 RepID=UPI0016216D11|nr:PAS domain-containing protein [Parvularcula dongshanensis]
MNEHQTFPLPSPLPGDLSQKTLASFPLAMVLADPNQDDCPIVYVNSAFVRDTGYSANAVVGRNCRFLQGPGTRESDRSKIRAAIEGGEEVSVDILNYRADGTPFLNRLLITPLRDPCGKVTYFLGVQTRRQTSEDHEERARELDERLRELQHRVKNHLAMILAMIRLEAAEQRQAPEFAETISRRVEAISLLYDEFATRTGGEENERIHPGAYLSRIASAVHEIDGRPEVRLNVEIAKASIAIDTAARLGLYLSEVLTNAFRHAFGERDEGEVRIELTCHENTAELHVLDDGCGTPDGAWPRADSLGGRIVLSLVERIGGDVSVQPRWPDQERPGTRVTLRFET